MFPEKTIMSIKPSEHTPLMQQYHDVKAQHPNTLVLFQVGDFYELFFDDAKRAAAFLGIALTARGKNKGEPIPLCGVPVHVKDHYVAKLVKGGFNVAICDQLEQPKPGTVVKRGVTQVLTPGTLTDAKLLDEKTASYLFSFFPLQNQWGLLFGELLTAQLFATVLKADDHKILQAELARFFPDEVLVPNNKMGKTLSPLFQHAGYCTTPVDFSATEVEEKATLLVWMRAQFKESLVATIERHESLYLALYYFYAYIKRNQPAALAQRYNLNVYKPDDFLVLDPATQHNLELIKNNQGGQKNTLFSALDGAVTSMGSRMIKKWLLRPLVKQEAIVQRQEVIALLIDDVALAQQLMDLLMKVGDIERVIGRIGLSRASLFDYLSLMRALAVIPDIRVVLHTYTDRALLAVIYQHLDEFALLYQLLHASLNDDPSHDWLIRKGFDAQLDYQRELVTNSNEKIVHLECLEQEKTGIQSLKIRYNQVHGYYIEVTKANMHLVPHYFTRQQTLVGRERFITPELQSLQYEIVRARAEIECVEKAVFDRVKKEVEEHITTLRKLSYALSHLDALLGLAHVAYSNGYVRPTFNTNREVHIIEGRHPVIEQTSNSTFIPNDTHITDEQSFWIITGPNMGGKSTYLRQVALISIVGQCGSFVPARSACLPIFDRVFTRIGAGDNLAEGKSTFLVEMEETASICMQATKNSLVILDEVGRGTSTFDGLAIAHAVVEYIHQEIQARCLFATHYHELTQLQGELPGVTSHYAVSKKTRDGIVFLYKIAHGVADGSFGVEVAKLAQLPEQVIIRAQQLLHELTTGSSISIPKDSSDLAGAYAPIFEQNQQLKEQLAVLQEQTAIQKELLSSLNSINYDELSPKQAFDLLWQFKSSRFK
ncbi:MAG: DNA mismatch repair protein MutS [bacterium]|nr:DNA mismatch repair protein MutS [bacterium]